MLLLYPLVDSSTDRIFDTIYSPLHFYLSVLYKVVLKLHFVVLWDLLLVSAQRGVSLATQQWVYSNTVCIAPLPTMPGFFEVRNLSIDFAHFLFSVMRSECAPQPQKGTHGRCQIVLVKESETVFPKPLIWQFQSHSEKGVSSKMASVP